MVVRRTSNGRAAPDPVRVFVGTSAGDDAEACLVLEHTLRERVSVPVDLEWLRPSDDPAAPLGGWPTEGWATPWTPYRWAVPALAGWTGRAVYFDCPQVVLGDVATLAAAPMSAGAAVLLRRAGSAVNAAVMVWDCAAARRLVPPLEELRREVGAHPRLSAAVAGGSSLAGELPAGWAVGDVEYSDDPARATGSVHYANAHVQPHQRCARERLRAAGRRHWFTGTRLPHFCPGMVELFEREYAAALAAGYAVDAYVPGGMATGREAGHAAPAAGHE